MDKTEDIKSSFSRKLDEIQTQHEAQLEAELKSLRESILKETKPSLLEIAAGYNSDLGDDSYNRRESAAPGGLIPLQERVEISRSVELRKLDSQFAQLFDLGDYYSTQRLFYPTVYCETLAEFFTPIVEQMDISSQARQEALGKMIQEAEILAEESGGGGVFGYNLPAVGCCLNGWLFVYDRDITPLDAFQYPELKGSVLKTAVHEKYGHGFIGAYSALGKVKSSLGLDLADLAQRYKFRTADDPKSSLRSQQANLLAMFSQLLEEGWATWIETYMAQVVLDSSQHPRHNLPAVRRAIEELPGDVPERRNVQAALQGALMALFKKDPTPLTDLHKAVLAIDVLGSDLEEHFQSTLGQPLEYAVGELILMQAQENLGARCVPFAVLVAANLTFDLSEISLVDLSALMQNDLRLNPDARLAVLSRMRLGEKNSVSEMAESAAAKFSFSVPPELKRGH